MTAMKTPRVREAVPAALELDDFWIESMAYTESGSALSDAEPRLRISRPELMQRVDGDELYRSRIRCVVTDGADRKLDLVMCGTFRLTGDALTNPNAFLHHNAPAILLGAMRGIVATVTAWTQGGRFDLPSVNLAATFD